ncbi:MAG TPA: hypothetical protein VK791_05365 [bacterium]|nr:hypothetical protein [bacterium]
MNSFFEIFLGLRVPSPKTALITFFLVLFVSFWLCSPVSAETYRPQVLFSMKPEVFGQPAECDVDSQENFYLLSATNSLVHIYDKTGKRIGFFRWEGAPRPHLRVDDKGNILISSKEAGQTWVYDRKGKLLKKSAILPAADSSDTRSFPAIDEYHFVRVLAQDGAGDTYALYRFEKDKAVYHFQVSNTEDNPDFRTYKFDKNLKRLFSFNSAVIFNQDTQNVYGFRLGHNDQVEFLKWVPIP